LHVWDVEELVALLPKGQLKKRGPYKSAQSSVVPAYSVLSIMSGQEEHNSVDNEGSHPSVLK